ncbi:MAG: tRNA adenosine(34) deaminase TadA [Oscillospiraceae bacterium]
MLTDDEIYMRKALELARRAQARGEVPVGAIVVRTSDGTIVGEGYNLRESGKSPLAHAELLAIDQASRTLGGWRLIGCTLYVTLEPCPMCAGAIINSRVERVVFGARDAKAGACETVLRMFDLPFNHKPALTGGVLEADCAGVLSEFFRNLRAARK